LLFRHSDKQNPASEFTVRERRQSAFSSHRRKPHPLPAHSLGRVRRELRDTEHMCLIASVEHCPRRDLTQTTLPFPDYEAALEWLRMTAAIRFSAPQAARS
jgi:hypothetical protein